MASGVEPLIADTSVVVRINDCMMPSSAFHHCAMARRLHLKADLIMSSPVHPVRGPLFDDPVVQHIRAIKERLAREADFDVHALAEIIRQKRPTLAGAFGIEIPNPEEAKAT